MSEIKQKDTIVDLIHKLRINLKYLLSKWLIIILFSSCISIFAIIVISNTPQTYHASLSFVAENGSNDKIGGYAGIAAQFGIDLGQSGGSIFEGDNLLEMFRSRKLIETTLFNSYNSSQNYLDQYLINHNIKLSKKILKNKLDYTDRYSDSIVNYVYKAIVSSHLTIEKKDKKNSIIYINFIDTNEEFAKKFIENLCENAIKFYVDYKTKNATQNLAILQKQADSLYNIISGKIVDVAQTTDLNVNPLKSVISSPIRQKSFDLNVSQVVYTEVIKQLELAKITYRKSTPLIQIIDTPILPLKKLKMGRLFGGFTFFIFGIFSISIFLLLKKTLKKISEES